MACTEEPEVRSDIMVDCTSHFTAKQVFDNKDELLTWVRDIGRINGFVIIIRTSDYGGGRKRPRIYLACERSGKYRLLHKKKRNLKTKTYRTRTSLPSAYVGDFPPMLIPFIKLMKDVDGDGNCGFRAIAV
ncbi:hypothetical protein CsSME_00010810 [Camellia sinensis var. sinensis]